MTVPLSDDVRGSYLKLAPGTMVTIRSFTATSSGLANNNGMLPGIYENFRWMNVETADGQKETVPQHYLDDTNLPRLRRERAKIADLPEVPFCEGDTVIALGGRYCKIVNIDYLAFWNKQNGEADDGIRRPFTVRSTEGSLQSEVSADEMKLVKRGMVHAYYAGNAVDFDNAEEEAQFYTWLGHAESIVNEASKTRAFTRDEAITALQAGDADVVLSINNHFEPLVEDKTYHLHKFRDEAVGARVREAYMATLDVPAPKFA
ncbi:hypothetical protein [Rhizobium sp. MHM7A]|uniref:hypothetical protein n=1 Tax=Rhizobium sp. MHM7A TaxID=2583233 RepID=UPI0012879950|nr:hypothetical protein [Rhizobium sp. MHM7A]TLX16441.1 hypothetical protein FFR93_03650 [Rhizobium sp. MHM7A]